MDHIIDALTYLAIGAFVAIMVFEWRQRFRRFISHSSDVPAGLTSEAKAAPGPVVGLGANRAKVVPAIVVMKSYLFATLWVAMACLTVILCVKIASDDSPPRYTGIAPPLGGYTWEFDDELALTQEN